MKQESNINLDDKVDAEIISGLNLNDPKSFFLFAGAGSGKTRTLINVLSHIKKEYKNLLSLNNQKVAIITYTNAACDEIKSRLDHDTLFEVSTIHSFTWQLIRHYTEDIKNWIKIDLNNDILDLKDKQSRSRGVNKSSLDREKKIESKKNRLSKLLNIKEFIYNPNGDNLTKDSLNHSQVIKLGAFFLNEKELMGNILVRKFPILLIDESQDTNKALISSFFTVQGIHKANFSLGLIGDMMQRIFLDGKEGLEKDIPSDWNTPKKRLNHRCPKRVVDLINNIRLDGDGQQQKPRNDKENGVVRLFLAQSPCKDKRITELKVAKKMAKITNDLEWAGDNAKIKTLTLEHHMAAKRMGFSDVFEPLYEISKLKTSLLNGSLSEMHFFSNTILPLYEACMEDDKFEIAKIIKEKSPLLDRRNIESSNNQIDLIQKANEAVQKFYSLWKKDVTPSLLKILNNVSNSKLFTIPESLMPIVSRSKEDLKVIEQSDVLPEDESDEIIDAWDKVLESSLDQIKLYKKYISDEGDFGTHQGVKGREFPRVMVVLDDDESRGNLFSYEKLFGVVAMSERDIKNKADGKETGFERTLRLFYVSCSRAEKSLAIIAYTSNRDLLKKNVIEKGWFSKEEIEFC